MIEGVVVFQSRMIQLLPSDCTTIDSFSVTSVILEKPPIVWELVVAKVMQLVLVPLPTWAIVYVLPKAPTAVGNVDVNAPAEASVTTVESVVRIAYVEVFVPLTVGLLGGLYNGITSSLLGKCRLLKPKYRRSVDYKRKGLVVHNMNQYHLRSPA